MKSLLSVLAALTLLFGIGMAQQTAQEGGQANLRVAHLAPDKDDISITVDGQSVFDGLSFRDVSSYESVTAGTAEVEVMENGDQAASAQLDFEENMYYTLVVLPGEGEEDVQIMLFADEVTVTAEDDQVLVRVFHGKYDADEDEVDVAFSYDDDTEVVFEDLTFGTMTSYFTMSAEATLEIREAGEDEVLTDASSDDFESGNVYTVFITEDDDGDMDLLVEEDDIEVQEEQ